MQEINVRLVSSLTVLFFIVFALQIFFWTGIFRKILHVPSPKHQALTAEKVTIVICAKNELENLKISLPKILIQNNQNFSVLIADDFSVDGTKEYISELQENRSNLIYYHVKTDRPGKKHALSEGLKQVKEDWVLLTDADCIPLSNQWIDLMMDARSNENQKIVLVYSPYTYNGSFLSLWIQFDSWINGLQYLGLTLIGLPYMGVGRNLLLDKKLLADTVLLKHSDLASGDDDLSINQISTANNTTVCLDSNAFTVTECPKTLMAYFTQKTRHYSTAHRYKFKHKLVLSCFSLSQILFVALLVFFLIFNFKLAILLYLLRVLFIISTVRSLMKILRASFGLDYFVLFDILLALFYLIFSFAVIFPKKNKWS